MNNPANFMQTLGQTLGQMLGQIKADPLSFLGRKYNIPQGMTNPNDIIQHLMNTGQVSQQQYNAVNQAARQYFNK